uniref:Uncharacterized protein n=1 Tax=Candidatus Kentrum sp. LFY TaxID=2126342 RepID=A0A450USW6_9GAMM|nr:MAG: hypothetical protein BECKLFY1418A_GA0070994_10528 [Candidatus Kentron sp. LFY]
MAMESSTKWKLGFGNGDRDRIVPMDAGNWKIALPGERFPSRGLGTSDALSVRGKASLERLLFLAALEMTKGKSTGKLWLRPG